MADRSLARDLTVGVAAVGLTLLTAFLLGFLAFGANVDEDDRPPIIVYNSTIDLMAVPILGVPGYWDPAAPNEASYRHVHGKGGPDKFKVHVGGAVASNDCDEDKYDNVRVIELAADTQGSEKVSIKSEGQSNARYTVVYRGGFEAAVSGPLLHLGAAAHHVRWMRLYKQDPNQPNPPANNVIATCTFADDANSPKPYLLIEQKR